MRVLMDREQQCTDSKGRTLYNVFESYQYAKRVASVGPNITLAVASADAPLETVTQDGVNFLNEQYRQYGPKVLPNDLSFDYSFLRPRPDKS